MRMTYAEPQKHWIDQVVPLSDAEPAKLYWETDIPAAEIIEAYAPGLHPNQITSIAGAAYTPFACTECEDPVLVNSRSRAQSLFVDERKVRRYADTPSMRRWPHKLLCAGCQQARQDAASAPFRQEMEQRRQREAVLRSMPYREYLKTSEWAATRAAALKRARYTCQTCASGGTLHVHHRTYVRRGSEWSSDLIVLCAGCHELFHKNGKLAENGRAA